MNNDETTLHLDLPVIRGESEGTISIDACREGIEVGAGLVIPWEFIRASERLLIVRGLIQPSF